MIETLTLITLTVIALIVFRPGKTEPLDSPLVINRVGQFRAVLAPKLNLAQPFLESVSEKLADKDRESGNTAPHYYKVSDPEVRSHGKDYYLLAATLRDGVLYFQAARPDDTRSDLETIRAFSAAELSGHPGAPPRSERAENALSTAIQASAAQRGAGVTRIEE